MSPATTVNSGSPVSPHRIVRSGSCGFSDSIRTRLRLERRAQQILERHPHFCGRTDFIRCHVAGRCLCLDGWLPSWYLKQLAQEALRELEGDIRIENRIVVASPVGEVSGVPSPAPASDAAPAIRKPR